MRCRKKSSNLQVVPVKLVYFNEKLACFTEIFAKSQPCKMSCRIPCDFGKCHEVSCTSRELNASNKSLSWRDIYNCRGSTGLRVLHSWLRVRSRRPQTIHSSCQCSWVESRTGLITRHSLSLVTYFTPRSSGFPLPGSWDNCDKLLRFQWKRLVIFDN